MAVQPDGIAAAAKQEIRLHPTNPNNSPITAWDRRRATLELTITKLNEVDARLAALEARPAARPFP